MHVFRKKKKRFLLSFLEMSMILVLTGYLVEQLGASH